MDGLISVIIPVYNRQNVVEECVRSVLAQSHHNMEILLIDDGSSDGTVSVCRKLEEADGRVKLFEMAHAGVSAARNKGVDEANGEYIFFLDSDDVIHPLLLQTLADGMKQWNAAMAGTGIVNVPERRWHRIVEKIAQDSDAPETDYQHHQDALRGVFRSTTPINLIGGVMMRRDLIGQTRFRTDLFIGEDFYFIYENLIKGADAVFLKQKWYYCRFHATNSSFNYTYDAFWSRFYRRELVWKNEEAMGRIEHVKLQKRDAVSVFVRCLVQNKPNSEDTKKMCRTMKDYRRALFPALSLKGKIACLLAIYAPAVYFRIHKLYHDLRRKRKR